MNDDDIRREFLTKLAVPVWPVAGKALGLGTTRPPARQPLVAISLRSDGPANSHPSPPHG
jgi:hypothetical protein